MGGKAQQSQFLVALDQDEVGELAGEVFQLGIGQAGAERVVKSVRQLAFHLAGGGGAVADHADAPLAQRLFLQQPGHAGAPGIEPVVGDPGLETAPCALKDP